MTLTDRHIANSTLRQSPYKKSFRRAGDIAVDCNDWPTAADSYRSHLALYPEDAPVWMKLGKARKEEGDLPSAYDAYQHALSLTPTDAELLLDIGNIYKLMGNFAAALDAYKQSAQLASGSSKVAALIQIEQLVARLGWCNEKVDNIGPFPTSYASLIAIVKKGEDSGHGVFRNYFRSFEAR